MSDGCLIGGAWVPAAAGTLPAEDPSDGSEIGRIARGGPPEVDAAVAAARAALAGGWGRATAAERGRLLARIGRATGETIPYLAGYTVYTLREPHGATGHIIPWNYPMQMVGRSVAPRSRPRREAIQPILTGICTVWNAYGKRLESGHTKLPGSKGAYCNAGSRGASRRARHSDLISPREPASAA